MTQAPANLRTSSWIASSLALISLISSLKAAVWSPNQGRYGLMRQVTITSRRMTEFQVPFTSHTQFMLLHLCFLKKRNQWRTAALCKQISMLALSALHHNLCRTIPQSLSYYTTIFVGLYHNLCCTIPQSLSDYTAIFVILYHNLCRTVPQSLSYFTTIFVVLYPNLCRTIPQSLSYYTTIFVGLYHNLCPTTTQFLLYYTTIFVVLYHNLCCTTQQTLSYCFINFVVL
ncbi:hypothetical protein GJAV_G00037820 [Gymnothorax javanicus]|nr:hypothetical protein GJAV_G00037820 [Gymnothorax javanicus]